MNHKEDQLLHLLEQEKDRQQGGINLIASENYASADVMKMVGSCLMNKYVEGNVGARYYSGCEFVDAIEQETIDQFKTLFKAEHVNVQSHSGSQANQAVYMALLKPGDTILSMSLSHGGHLTHGHKINFSGQLYNIVSYGVDQQTELIDYDEVEQLALEHKPKMIIAGSSAFTRIIDFERFARIAKKVGAYLLADMAHIAGLVAVNLHPSPVPYADVVTMTTHKTFRGPRGAVIMCKKELAQQVDRAVMPGLQGGAFMNVIAAKGVACQEAMQDSFVTYQRQVIKNAQAMAQRLADLGYRIVAEGTDTHMLLVDIGCLGLTGKQIEQALESVQIYVNRNMIPFDTKSPLQASGIRVGTAALTTRGATEQDCVKLVGIIDQLICATKEQKDILHVKEAVQSVVGRLLKIDC